MHSNQHNIFQIPIWGFILNDQQYQTYDFVDRLLELEEKEPSVRKSNFGGYQTRDNIHETEGVLKEFTSALNNIANSILCSYTNKKVSITEMWGNINYKNCYNGAHTHSGLISGVYYCQVPENSGNLVLVNPAVRSDGHLLRLQNYVIKPERLALILFPSWLEHYVEPNQSDQERISISFNIG